jgi:hypothetical protein
MLTYNPHVWKHVPAAVLEWRGRLVAATSKLHRFLEAAVSGGEVGINIERVEGAVTWVNDFEEVFERRHGPRTFTIDAAAFAAFGFKVSDDRIAMCAACKRIAKSRGGKCCPEYNNENRKPRRIIFNMQMHVRPEVAPVDG